MADIKHSHLLIGGVIVAVALGAGLFFVVDRVEHQVDDSLCKVTGPALAALPEVVETPKNLDAAVDVASALAEPACEVAIAELNENRPTTVELVTSRGSEEFRLQRSALTIGEGQTDCSDWWTDGLRRMCSQGTIAPPLNTGLTTCHAWAPFTNFVAACQQGVIGLPSG
jgi:hypothetical protein